MKKKHSGELLYLSFAVTKLGEGKNDIEIAQNRGTEEFEKSINYNFTKFGDNRIKITTSIVYQNFFVVGKYCHFCLCHKANFHTKICILKRPTCTYKVWWQYNQNYDL